MNYKVEKALKYGGPHLLIGAGIGGFILSIGLCAAETTEAIEAVKREEYKKGRELTSFEWLKVAGPKYLKTFISMVLSTASVTVGTLLLDKKAEQFSTLAGVGMSMYNNLESKLSNEERKKAIATVDTPEEKEDDEVLFYEKHIGYFLATKENVLRSICYCNQRLGECGGVTLKTFYEGCKMKDPPVDLDAYDNIGWDVEYLSYNTCCCTIPDPISDPIQDGDGPEVYELVWPIDPVYDPWNYDPWNDSSAIRSERLV